MARTYDLIEAKISIEVRKYNRTQKKNENESNR